MILDESDLKIAIINHSTIPLIAHPRGWVEYPSWLIEIWSTGAKIMFADNKDYETKVNDFNNIIDEFHNEFYSIMSM
jgi:hypothetical protein